MSSVQLDDNIRIWLLEEEEFNSAPDYRKLESVGAETTSSAPVTQLHFLDVVILIAIRGAI